MIRFQQWDQEFGEEFRGWSKEEQEKAIFLEQHPIYPAYLLANSTDPLFPHTLKDQIGEYRTVHKLQMESFSDEAEKKGYKSLLLLEGLRLELDHLDDPYPFELSVQLKKFQIRGFNYTKDKPVAFINWSTGTGKSVYAVARAKYLLETEQIDKVVVLSKRHNKINWQRTFERIGNLQASTDLEGKGSSAAARRAARAETYANSKVFVINYEKMKFRPTRTSKTLAGQKTTVVSSGDGQELLAALKGKRVLWIWDEMTNKMKSMQTGWYKGAQRLTKACTPTHVILTAKKIDTDPENIYSCIKIVDPTIWPSKSVFRSMYAKSFSTWNPYQVAVWDRSRLPEIGMRIAHFTHIANKYTDPDIRAEFPEDHWEDILIDMSDQDRKLYDLIANELANSLAEDGILANRLAPLQAVCNNPLALAEIDSPLAELAQEKFQLTDRYSAKLETLQDLLEQIEGKAVLFSAYTTLGTKMLVPYLIKWGYSFVIYDGTPTQMQAAHDRFRTDESIKIFLSSDKGSDSIDLEQASTVINYDLPWNHSTLVQRVNRISRLTSDALHVYFFNLIMADTMEERRLKVLEQKRLMEEAVDTHVSEQSDLISNSEITDLRWLLLG